MTGRITITILTLLLLISADTRQGIAQEFDRSVTPFPVFDEAGNPLGSPFAGGLLEPRIGLRDFDRDGRPDLFTLNPDFELRAYRNVAGSGFVRVFPSPYDALPIRSWFRFADIDADGDDDLFTGGPTSEVLLYRNIASQSNPSFSQIPDTLRGADGQTVITQLETVPALVDIDADGDLDYLMGNIAGDISFYENTGSPQAPVFTFRTSRFEDILVVSAGSTRKPGRSASRSERHGASVFGFGDIDMDSDYDLLFGDFFTRRLLLFHNTGTPSRPDFSMNRLDTAFRPTGDDVESEGFNQAETGDIDTDGDQDVLVSSLYPNATAQPIILYANTGTARAPIHRRSPVNVTGELDEGTFAAPVAINDRARSGVLIGSASVTSEATIGTITYFSSRTVDGRTEWREIETFGIPGWGRVSPAVGDLDDDGLMEVVVGGTGSRQKMTIMKFEGNRLVDAPWTLDDFTGINSNTSPTLGDLDGDGDLDLLTGAENGRIFYFKNIGTRSAPQFVRADPPAPFAGFRAGGDSAPRLFDLDGDGDLDLMIGNRNGGALGGRRSDGVRFYLNDGGTFAVSDAHPDIDRPDRTVPTPMMLDLAEGRMLFLGTEAGGIEAYIERIKSDVTAPDIGTEAVVARPSLLESGNTRFTLQAPDIDRDLMIVDVVGRPVGFRLLETGPEGTVLELTGHPASGAYFCRWSGGGRSVRIMVIP